MFFERDFLKVNILSVLSLGWKECDAHTAGRSYNALSYRICGNADFTHGDIFSPRTSSNVSLFYLRSGAVLS